MESKFILCNINSHLQTAYSLHEHFNIVVKSLNPIKDALNYRKTQIF